MYRDSGRIGVVVYPHVPADPQRTPKVYPQNSHGRSQGQIRPLRYVLRRL
jgi:hypothetical protein